MVRGSRFLALSHSACVQCTGQIRLIAKETSILQVLGQLAPWFGDFFVQTHSKKFWIHLVFVQMHCVCTFVKFDSVSLMVSLQERALGRAESFLGGACSFSFRPQNSFALHNRERRVCYKCSRIVVGLDWCLPTPFSWLCIHVHRADNIGCTGSYGS